MVVYDDLKDDVYCKHGSWPSIDFEKFYDAADHQHQHQLQ